MMLRVVAAVIHDPAGRILIARRPLHKHQGGLWEFPGGKVEPGESAWDALSRELGEELGIEPQGGRPLLTVEHHYPDKSVRLEVWRVTAFSGEAHGAEGQPIAWVGPQQLCDYQFPAANAAIIRAASLPPLYGISPDPTEVDDDFPAWLEHRLSTGQWLLLRAKSLGRDAYRKLAQDVVARLNRRGVRVMLHDRPDLLAEIPAQGVHLTAATLATLPEGWRRDAAGLTAEHVLGVSAHTSEELDKAWRAGADFAMLSPVRRTASHPDADGMGWKAWEGRVRNAGLPVYALGGMTPDDLTAAQAAGGQGVAGIRGFLLGQHGGDGRQ